MLEPRSGKVGLKLTEDPFFQYIKENRLARELLIKPTELFTPEKIVNLALRQDIGIDDASSNTLKKLHKRENLNFLETFNLENTPSQTEEIESGANYFSQENGLDWQDYREKDYLAVKLPMNKGVLRMRDIEPINVHDLHWRNTALLSEFLNSCAKIQSVVQNRLPAWQQRKVARVIKHARQMRLLPHKSFVRPHHKISMRSLEEDIQDAMVRKVDLETGAMVAHEPERDWNVRETEDFEEEADALLNHNFEYFAFGNNF